MDIKKRLLELGITPNKALGQNFLVDDKAIVSIVSTADIEGKNVLEIGPGLGALTVELNRLARRLLAVELDTTMIKALSSIPFPRPESIAFINADFLKVGNEDICSHLTQSFCVVANLPYYVTTPICLKLLQSGLNIESMTLMMQKEAAERFTAGKGSKVYGAASILTDYLYTVDTVIELAPSSYYPQPDVHSVVLHFASKGSDISVVPSLSRVLKAAFSARRKTMLNNVMSLGVDKRTAADILMRANISTQVRAEQLETNDFLRLAEAADRTK